MSEPYIALQVLMMPKDANRLPSQGAPGASPVHYVTIFGGVILSYIDQAGAIGAVHEIVKAGGPLPHLVTVAINRVEFKKPVLVGDVVRLRTRLVRFGTTSVTINVQVEAERGLETLQVTEAEIVYVGIDPQSPQPRPKPLLPDPHERS